MKAYGYLRVSGKGQVDGDGFERQRLEIEKYAQANGIEVVEYFREKGVSGTTEWGERRAWMEMLDRIISNGVKVILIERLDRLAREYFIQEHILRDLRKQGIKLISATEPDLGEEDPTRKMFRTIMGAIVEYDKTMTVLKLRGARQRMKAKEGWCEGQKPYGLKDGEGETLRRILELAGDGLTQSAISAKLNADGLKPRSGAKWYPGTVARIMRVAR